MVWICALKRSVTPPSLRCCRSWSPPLRCCPDRCGIEGLPDGHRAVHDLCRMCLRFVMKWVFALRTIGRITGDASHTLAGNAVDRFGEPRAAALGRAEW